MASISNKQCLPIINSNAQNVGKRALSSSTRGTPSEHRVLAVAVAPVTVSEPASVQHATRNVARKIVHGQHGRHYQPPVAHGAPETHAYFLFCRKLCELLAMQWTFASHFAWIQLRRRAGKVANGKESKRSCALNCSQNTKAHGRCPVITVHSRILPDSLQSADNYVIHWTSTHHRTAKSIM